jgi:cytoskeletal protein CcmA (bactofilin family)
MATAETAKTVIAEDVEIVGSIKCTSTLHLAGKLNGDAVCAGSLVIGETASVKGNITAESTSILGQVNGNITARDRIELKASARINGDIKAKRLTVEDGVTFIGKSEVNPSGAAGGRPASSDARPPAAEMVQADYEETARHDEAETKGRSTPLFGRK